MTHLEHFKARLPPNATLLGITLSSDKTKLSTMTGDRVAHPLLITLANIDSAIRSSSSSHALSLLALLPVPKFVGVCHRYDFLVRLHGTDLVFFELFKLYFHLGLITTPMFSMFT